MKSGKSRFPAHLVLETSWSLNISESRADDSVDDDGDDDDDDDGGDNVHGGGGSVIVGLVGIKWPPLVRRDLYFSHHTPSSEPF